MTEPTDDTPNEILAAAKEAKDHAEAAAKAAVDKAKSWPLGAIGLGVGIGSAAIAGAVLYANRPRSKK
ncbi:hypothetical protein FSB78_17260 [Sphingomonas ginsenosidivorax]|jgi:hypothetical protein|uniref:Uncharacterized protein n=1 Tax=Sphingomonas ginsenosidivorax TaxID=862135 RepID=A0A5C6UJQ4_9SPHN|nr:hypothetical protein [Sphingomonas ginsenosidivorax]TXC72501.1 hypothetical protein FSB78_17260 [Sphingomonas ginsenosidivorax]